MSNEKEENKSEMKKYARLLLVLGKVEKPWRRIWLTMDGM